jgi:hypothetical protein
MRKTVQSASSRYRTKAYRGRVLERLKTTNAHRVVDVHPTVAAHLIAFIGKRTGLLFAAIYELLPGKDSSENEQTADDYP